MILRRSNKINVASGRVPLRSENDAAVKKKLSGLSEDENHLPTTGIVIFWPRKESTSGSGSYSQYTSSSSCSNSLTSVEMFKCKKIGIIRIFTICMPNIWIERSRYANKQWRWAGIETRAATGTLTVSSEPSRKPTWNFPGNGQSPWWRFQLESCSVVERAEPVPEIKRIYDFIN